MKHTLLVLAGLLELTAASAVLADDAPVSIFMEPQSGLMVVMPGTADFSAIVTAASGFAEANVEATQSLVNNTIIVEGGESSVEFAGSGNSLTGIYSINQEAGNMNNQGNIRSIAVIDAGGGFADVTLDINTTQTLLGNDLTLRNTGPRSVSITDSFNGATGIVGINQSAGNLNQQLTVVAVGLGVNVGPGSIQLGDSQLGQIGSDTDNSLKEEGVQGPRTNTLANSFNDFHGIAQISQTTGDMNRVTQAVGVSIVTPSAP